jgi:hypothetical protein
MRGLGGLLDYDARWLTLVTSSAWSLEMFADLKTGNLKRG